MSTEEKREIIEFTKRLAAARKDLSTEEIITLRRKARRHHSLQEIQSNREATAREVKEESRLEESIRAMLAPLAVSFGGDPRGYTVRVHFPDGSYNTWGGREHGWGI